jgi:hypothetical protein
VIRRTQIHHAIAESSQDACMVWLVVLASFKPNKKAR